MDQSTTFPGNGARYLRLHRYHNILLGLFAVALFGAFIALQFERFSHLAGVLVPLFSSFLAIDGALIFFLVLFLPTTPKDRAVVADLNTPIALLVISITVAAALVNIFAKQKIGVKSSFLTYIIEENPPYPRQAGV